MKLFTASLFTESCDLTPIPTTEDDWLVTRPEDRSKNTEYSDLLTLFREMAEAKGWQVTESISALAFPPGGRTVRTVYENLRSTIINDLKKAMPVDGVLLQLHGAAMAHGYDDCEGDLLEHIRAIVGPEVPIGVELDPHCHMTDKMMNNATAIILYKTLRHTDRKERAIELFNLIAATLEQQIKPTMALFDCRMIQGFDEQCEPIKTFMASVAKREREPGVLSISIVHGYGFADIADMGSKMLVITDNNPELAYQIAEELGLALHEFRGQENIFLDREVALVQAEKMIEGERGLVLADWADSSACGFPTDGTELLRTLLDRGMTNVAIGLMFDPQVVSICHSAGVGAELSLRIGGKFSPLFGDPLDLNVTVERLYKATDEPIASWPGEMTRCDIAVVRSGETELLLSSKRVLGIGIKYFVDLGIDPEAKHYLILKCAYQAGLDGLKPRKSLAIAGGVFDYPKQQYKRITRPKWPWDKNPFEGHKAHSSSQQGSVQ